MDAAEARRLAQAYLNEQLGSRAPLTMELAASFNEAPLDNQGQAFVFSFDLSGGASSHAPSNVENAGCAPQRHFVVAGDTQPNYFPAYAFDADDGYSYHIGTSFLLEMGVQRVQMDEPPGARERLMRFLLTYARAEQLGEIRVAAIFACQEQFFVIYDVRIDADRFYCMGCDCPPGCYALTRFPPQVALRLHLGKLIRAEARTEKRPLSEPNAPE
jgi:hypothetical protein